MAAVVGAFSLTRASASRVLLLRGGALTEAMIPNGAACVGVRGFARPAGKELPRARDEPLGGAKWRRWWRRVTEMKRDGGIPQQLISLGRELKGGGNFSAMLGAGKDKMAMTRWRLIDAEGQVVGRLASHLSNVLQGKDKPYYSPHSDCGDIVVVKNASRVTLTGRKWLQKGYFWHTGYPGGLKERKAREQFEQDPCSILRKAVSGMLPKNNLRRSRMRKLLLFPEEEENFGSEVEFVPLSMPERKVRTKAERHISRGGMAPALTKLKRTTTPNIRRRERVYKDVLTLDA